LVVIPAQAGIQAAQTRRRLRPLIWERPSSHGQNQRKTLNEYGKVLDVLAGRIRRPANHPFIRVYPANPVILSEKSFSVFHAPPERIGLPLHSHGFSVLRFARRVHA